MVYWKQWLYAWFSAYVPWWTTVTCSTLIEITGKWCYVCSIWSIILIEPILTFKPRASALNSTMALRQANSAGSTHTERNLQRISWSWRTELSNGRLPLSIEEQARCSLMSKRGWTPPDGDDGDVESSGRHHCTAHSKNNSDHVSSKRITWAE